MWPCLQGKQNLLLVFCNPFQSRVFLCIPEKLNPATLFQSCSLLRIYDRYIRELQRCFKGIQNQPVLLGLAQAVQCFLLGDVSWMKTFHIVCFLFFLIIFLKFDSGQILIASFSAKFQRENLFIWFLVLEQFYTEPFAMSELFLYLLWQR